MWSSIVVLLCFVSDGLSLGQQRVISFTDGPLQLAGNGVATLILSSTDFPGVIRAGQDLAADFGKITGKNLTIAQISTDQTSTTGPAIIAGTLGKSALIDSLVSAGKIDISQIQGQWESFVTQIVTSPVSGVASALVIAGSDKRGTIYGIYDISEQIGVSPWYWFADVPSTQQTNIFALDIHKTQGPPSVKYRGIFLNDEQPALTNWVKEKYGGVGYVSGFYARVFELLLRLRANYLWPTMWDSMFALDDTKNQPLADTYGIVMGTSHTEPLMRSTKEQTKYVSGSWDWTSNKANIIKFLTDGANRAKPYESLYTMGMRGSGDTASSTLTAASLADVVSEQQKILTSVIGNVSTIPQMWCLYKEVGGYYQKGLKVPDDITLLWSDDNSGNMQRLPIPSEVGRVGGAGVYYHFDYVGDPRNYKWINTIAPQKTWEQMHMTYNRNAREIWVVNVGDLKPLEIPINHFLDMAYNMTLFTSPNSTDTWLSQFAAMQFGAAVSDQVASLIDTYSHLAARRKYELLDSTIFSVINYNEADTVLAEWHTLVSSAQAIYDSLPAASQPAFFQLVLHPAKAGSILYDLYVSTAKNNLYAKQGRVSSTTYGTMATTAFQADKDLASTYHKLLGGKWNHMMDQTHIGYTSWQQPSTNNMPAQSTPAKSTNGAAGVFVDGGSTTLALPSISLYGPASRWIDIYSKGSSATSFTISSDPWVKASPASGQLTPPGLTSDQRVNITIDWSTAPTSTTTSKIIVTAGGTDFTVTIPLSNTALPANFTGFVESDKTISIEPEHWTSVTSTSKASYGVIPNYGRSLSGVTLFPVTISSQTPLSSPKLSYNIYVFTATTASITLYLGPSLNTGPSRPLTYAISIDDAAPTNAQYVPITDLGTLPSTWTQGVERQGYDHTTKHDVTVGAHVLNLWALEPGVVFQKIVADLGGVRTSYLGPPESMRV
ncbi:uncharacterized protein LY89DRAFT_600152 [Mollisia scopiformis]|uniref:Gylcosyl hydrolase 115 C-terminal domain-containing protein n=1 Tax=Mollisia scopiformis TaxID=149040 RepID=A0A132B739_MOLSC|nr:uncharacterized protein LY89DRAFT_600152 [Mollisia scopiformis]KUJ08228.1 hypothetical protein LY89DRAFT_600152 [Mollisia scopiformis]